MQTGREELKAKQMIDRQKEKKILNGKSAVSERSVFVCSLDSELERVLKTEQKRKYTRERQEERRKTFTFTIRRPQLFILSYISPLGKISFGSHSLLCSELFPSPAC